MSEQVYSSAQVAKLLGVSGGMLRRYALSYEELTGEKIPQHPRDGRQFSQQHLDALISARRFVASRQGISVESGLRMALGLAEMPVTVQLPASTDTDTLAATESFKAALGAYAGPLLTELRTLNATNERLADEVATLRQELSERPKIAIDHLENPGNAKDAGTPLEAVQRSRGGLGERFGRRVDNLLRRFRVK